MSGLAGAGRLIRLVLRRDRMLLPLWVVTLALLPLTFVASFRELYPTVDQLRAYATAGAQNASFVALYGRLHGTGLGEVASWRAGFLPVMIGLFTMLTVIRHTRADEDAGRRELLGATVVGRHAGLAAVLVVTAVANLLLGAMTAIGMAGQGLPAGGSWALGLGNAGVGWVCAGVAAVTAQLSGDARGARTGALGVLCAAFVARLVGDVSAIGGGVLAWLSWLSPLHWAQETRPYAGQRWWPLALAGGVAVLLTLAATGLSARRDVGAGLLPPRLGPGTASRRFGSPFALAWRLHRGGLATWTVGFVALGVVVGGVADGVGDLVQGTALDDVFTRVGGAAGGGAAGGGAAGLVDSFLAAILSLLGLIAAGYAVQAGLRMREEETVGRVEPLLSTAVGRLRLAASHLTFSLVGPAVMLLAGGLATGVTHGLNVGDLGVVPGILAGAAVQLPAVWVVAAVTVGLFGLLPKLAQLGWVALAACLLITMVGPALRLNHWLLDVSPFTHVPHLPGGAVSGVPLAILGTLAAALTAAGLVGLRRRDIPVG